MDILGRPSRLASLSGSSGNRRSGVAKIQSGARPTELPLAAPLHVASPLLLFGGPYSNLEATRALLQVARKLAVPTGNVICTGDVVAYCADPQATAELIRGAGIHVLQGNCEERLASGAGDCGCGFSPGTACELLSSVWYDHAQRAVSSELRAWMAALPKRLDLEVGGRRLAVVHGCLASNNAFIFASTTADMKRAQMEQAGVDGVIAGHCGLPFTQVIDGRLWHNPGAIGLPANDGTPRGWYSLLIPDADGLRIAHRALRYDHRSAAAKMRKAGLPEGYAAALETGLWPSCDMLPEPEMRRRGLPLEASELAWRRGAWPNTDGAL